MRGSATSVTRCCASAARPARRRPRQQPVDQRARRRAPTRVCSGTSSRLAGGRLVERRDDPLDAAQVVGVVGDDERVAAGKRGDRVVRRDQRAQHVDELRGGLVAQRDHLRDQPVAARGDRAARTGPPCILASASGTILTTPSLSTAAKPCMPQRRQQRRIDERSRHRPRRDDVDRALDPRIDDEVAAGDLGHRLARPRRCRR